MRRSLLAAVVAAMLIVSPVAAAGSITIDQPGPYSVGQVVTLTVVVPKLKGYEYPVVLEWCGYMTQPGYEGVKNWVFFRRWDTEKGNTEAGPVPITLTTAGTCTFELWAYVGLNPGHIEHVLTVGPEIVVTS